MKLLTWAIGVWKVSRFTWRKRHDAVGFELFAIYKGKEFESYATAFGQCQTKAFQAWLERSPEPMPDLDSAWSELQRREGGGA